MDTCCLYGLATEDEYEQIAQTIRNDLVYSQYGQDVENLIQYIPNTADGCCLERDSYMNRIHLVFLNTGETYGLDVFDSYEPIENQRSTHHDYEKSKQRQWFSRY